MISRKKEDFRIYVEDDDKNWLKTNYILESEENVDKYIDIKINLRCRPSWDLRLTREEIKVFQSLFQETIKYL